MRLSECILLRLDIVFTHYARLSKGSYVLSVLYSLSRKKLSDYQQITKKKQTKQNTATTNNKKKAFISFQDENTCPIFKGRL